MRYLQIALALTASSFSFADITSPDELPTAKQGILCNATYIAQARIIKVNNDNFHLNNNKGDPHEIVDLKIKITKILGAERNKKTTTPFAISEGNEINVIGAIFNETCAGNFTKNDLEQDYFPGAIIVSTSQCQRITNQEIAKLFNGKHLIFSITKTRADQPLPQQSAPKEKSFWSGMWPMTNEEWIKDTISKYPEACPNDN